jgi:hypothetical protein
MLLPDISPLAVIVSPQNHANPVGDVFILDRPPQLLLLVGS